MKSINKKASKHNILGYILPIYVFRNIVRNIQCYAQVFESRNTHYKYSYCLFTPKMDLIITLKGNVIYLFYILYIYSKRASTGIVKTVKTHLTVTKKSKHNKLPLPFKFCLRWIGFIIRYFFKDFFKKKQKKNQ